MNFLHLPDELDDGGGEGKAHQDVDGAQHHVESLVWNASYKCPAAPVLRNYLLV